MKHSIKWIVFFVILSLLCLAAIFFMSQAKKGEKIANISKNGKIIKTIDLADVEEPYEFTVGDKAGGFNIIRVEHGRIAVIEADCPDKICLRQGFISGGALPIVCLPHKLAISVNARSEEYDVTVGGR